MTDGDFCSTPKVDKMIVTLDLVFCNSLSREFTAICCAKQSSTEESTFPYLVRSPALLVFSMPWLFSFSQERMRMNAKSYLDLKLATIFPIPAQHDLWEHIEIFAIVFGKKFHRDVEVASAASQI